MRFSLERTVEPDIEPIDLLEMKRHLRAYEDLDTEDDMIQSLITGAREWAEHESGRALIEQQWQLSVGEDRRFNVIAQDIPGRAYYGTYLVPIQRNWEFLLRRSPVLSLDAFVTVNADGTETAMDAAGYQLRDARAKWPRVVALNGGSWSSGLYRIRFRAGFADRSSSPQQAGEVVPVMIKQAMKLWAEAQYTRNEKNMQMLMDTASRLLEQQNTNVGFA